MILFNTACLTKKYFAFIFEPKGRKMVLLLLWRRTYELGLDGVNLPQVSGGGRAGWVGSRRRCSGGEWWPERGRCELCATCGGDLCDVVQCVVVGVRLGSREWCQCVVKCKVNTNTVKCVHLPAFTKKSCASDPTQVSPFRLHWSGYSLIRVMWMCIVTG